MFNVVEKELNCIHNINKIHPRKQRTVRNILKEIPRIKVFGSAIRWDCNEKSDIDILLNKNKVGCSKKEAYRKLVKCIDTDFDLLWEDEIKDNMTDSQKNNIIDRSVECYEEQ